MNDKGLTHSRGRKGIFYFTLCPDQLWGPPTLPSNGYHGPFPWGKVAAA